MTLPRSRADTLLGDFLLTYTVFMPTSQLCRALLHQYPSAAGTGGDWAPSHAGDALSPVPVTSGGAPNPLLGLLGASPSPGVTFLGVAAPSHVLLVPLTGPSFRAEPLEGSEQDKATYSLRKRRKILRLVSQWVLLYGRLLQGDRSTTALLQVRAG